MFRYSSLWELLTSRHYYYCWPLSSRDAAAGRKVAALRTGTRNDMNVTTCSPAAFFAGIANSAAGAADPLHLRMTKDVATATSHRRGHWTNRGDGCYYYCCCGPAKELPVNWWRRASLSRWMGAGVGGGGGCCCLCYCCCSRTHSADEVASGRR